MDLGGGQRCRQIIPRGGTVGRKVPEELPVGPEGRETGARIRRGRPQAVVRILW